MFINEYLLVLILASNNQSQVCYKCDNVMFSTSLLSSTEAIEFNNIKSVNYDTLIQFSVIIFFCDLLSIIQFWNSGIPGIHKIPSAISDKSSARIQLSSL